MTFQKSILTALLFLAINNIPISGQAQQSLDERWGGNETPVRTISTREKPIMELLNGS